MSSIRHHPPLELLLDHATGNDDPAHSLLIATHLSVCPACRADVRAYEAVGGELLNAIEPVAMLHGPLDPASSAPPLAMPVHPVATSYRLPQPLRSVIGDNPDLLRWRWIGGGLYQHKIRLQGGDRQVLVRLLRIENGGRLPLHTHTADELTLVLEGSYSDETGTYCAGDVQFGDCDVVHEPAVAAGETCLCLAVSCAPIRLARWPWRLFNFLFRF